MQAVDHRTLARAALQLAGPLIERLTGAEAKDPERRERFFRLVTDTKKIADGALTIPAESRGPTIEALAREASISDAALSEAAGSVAASQDAAMADALAFMAGLPRAAPLRPCIVQARIAPLTRVERARASYDVAAICDVLARIPDTTTWTERRKLEAMLLGDSDDDLPVTGDGPDPRDLDPDLMLVAGLRVVEHFDARVRESDADSAQTHREDLHAARRDLVRLAVAVAPSSRWPDAGTAGHSDRARSFAVGVRARRRFSSAEIDCAMVHLGHAELRSDA